MMRKRLFSIVCALCAFLVGCLAAGDTIAQSTCSTTIQGALESTDPLLLGRYSRYGDASSCTKVKERSSVAEASYQHLYDLHRFTNTSSSSACYSFSLSWPESNQMWAVAYVAGAFNPGDIRAGWLADMGQQLSSGMKMSLNVAAGASIDVVVYAINSGMYWVGGPYTLSASRCVQATFALESSPHPSVFGESVTMTATLRGDSGTPGGTVAFSDGTTQLGTAVLDSSGTASLTSSALPAGARTIRASYAGDIAYSPATSHVLTHTVNTAECLMDLGASRSPAMAGDPVTFVASLSAKPPSTGMPSGDVTLLAGTTPIGTGIIENGRASFATSNLGVGTHTIMAVYAGDGNYTACTAHLTQNIATPSAVLDIQPSPSSPTYGEDLTLTTTVAATSGGVPTGEVSFSERGVRIGSAAVDSNGVATFVIAAPRAGHHTFVAEYSGDTSHPGPVAGSVPIFVNKRFSMTRLAATPAPSYANEAVTLTATAETDLAIPEDAGTSGLQPVSGTVLFFDGAAMLGSATTVNGVATLTTTALTVGSHSLTARYTGAECYTESTSDTATQKVEAKRPDILADGGYLDGSSDAPISDVAMEVAPPDVNIPVVDSGPSDVTATDADASLVDRSLPPAEASVLDATPPQDTGSSDISNTPDRGLPEAESGSGGTIAQNAGGAAGTTAPIGTNGGQGGLGTPPDEDAGPEDDGLRVLNVGCGCRVAQPPPISHNALLGVCATIALLAVRRSRRMNGARPVDESTDDTLPEAAWYRLIEHKGAENRSIR